jgi:TolB-like protein
MVDERVSRRLAAILAADVVGYSRLMEADEAGTLAALKARRREVLEPLVGKHQGRVFKVTGDGVLVEFGSAVNAVQCAVELQQAFADTNSDLPDERRIVLRIGVNLGDVMVEGGDLYGDGVNIAARLEALSEPGGICVSEDAHRQVRNKMSASFDDLGMQTLRNITEPVRVYGVAPPPQPSPASRGRDASASERVGARTSDKPSIAVLPFTNMSGDPEQEYFSDGITEDIITELSRFRSLFVIARHSSFVFKGKQLKVQQIARDLGVGYVVEGSVRRAGERLRITAQLIEAESGNHIWAERYDRDAQDVFTIQDELAHAIAATVGGRIDKVARDRATRLSPDELRAYDLYLRAKAITLNYTKSGNAEARRLSLEAMSLDPMNATIKAYYSHFCFLAFNFEWSDDPEESLRTALEFGKQAVTIDDKDVDARWNLGFLYMIMRNFSEARVHMEKSIEFNPNNTWARAAYACFLTYLGDTANALKQFELVKRQNPFDESWIPWVRGIACYTGHRYGDAIDELSQIPEPHHEVLYWLAAACAQAGRANEARSKLEECLRLAERDMRRFPGRDAQAWRNYLTRANPFRESRDLQHLFDGLRKAGLPI